jgi:hypothetical protein
MDALTLAGLRDSGPALMSIPYLSYFGGTGFAYSQRMSNSVVPSPGRAQSVYSDTLRKLPVVGEGRLLKPWQQSHGRKAFRVL